MKIIPRHVHGAMDYIVGVALIAAPWLFQFADNGPATYIPVCLGIGTLLYSLLTNYELGLIRVIPFPIHLGLDLVAGLLLAASPWLFGFSNRVFLPHLVVGVIEIIAALTTRTVPTAAITHHPTQSAGPLP